MEAILIPVKRLEDAKARLAGRLDPQERRNLGLAMLEDVLAACRNWPLKFVVTSDPDAASAAAAAGCRVMPDPGQGLNAAVESGIGRLRLLGAVKVLVLPSDVPLAAAGDISDLFERRSVAVSPSVDGGTNALLTSPPGAIAPSFGPDSAAAHRKAAEAAGLAFELVPLPSLELDVDCFSDLERLAAVGGGGKSAALAAALITRERVAEVP